MTHRDDRFPDMVSSDQFDAAIEQALRGEAVGDDVASLARFVDDVRVMAAGPPPPPSPKLAELLAGSTANGVAPVAATSLAQRSRSDAQARSRSGRSRAAEMRMRVAASGLAGKAAVSLALAGAVAAGGAAGVLPEPATHFVRRAIEIVTPFELPDDATVHHRHGAHANVDATATPGNELSEAPLPPTGPRPAETARAAAVIDTRLPGVELHSDGDSPPLASPTADTSSEIRAHPKKGTSPAQGPKPAVQPLAPADNADTAQAPPPHGGPSTKPKPGLQRDQVPPGGPPSGGPHPGDSQSGDPRPKDRGPDEDRPEPSGADSPRSGPESPAGPLPGHGDQGSHDGPPAGQAPPRRVVAGPSVEPGAVGTTTTCPIRSSTG
jgi:hypothetical protein